MKTELTGTLRTGFTLSEKELRRIVGVTADKMKTSTDQIVEQKFTYKLANGAIVETGNIDDVFTEENIGTRRIVMLQFVLSAISGVTSEVRFVDLVIDKEEKNSIFNRLKGENRDPLFVLASELDERMSHISRINLRLESRETPLLTALFVMMISLFVMMTKSLQLLGNSTSSNVMEDYKNGKFSPDVQGLFQFIAKLEDSHRVPSQSIGELIVPALWPLILVPIVTFFFYFFRTYFYPFNFVWGEQVGVVERRDRQRNLVLVGVGLAMIIGVVSSYVAGLLPRP